MKEPKIQLLKDLLQKAISATEIRGRDGRAISVEDYKHLYREDRNFSAEDHDNRKWYRPYLQDEAVRDQILEFLKKELREYMRGDSVFFARTALTFIGERRADLGSILSFLLRVALLKGAEYAVRSFYRPIKKEWIPFRQLVLINGLEVEREVQLYDGVRLTPLPPVTKKLPDYLPVAGLPDRMNEDANTFCSATVMSIDCSVLVALRKPEELVGLSRFDPFPKNKAAGKWKIMSTELGSFGITDYPSYKTHFRHFYMLLSLVCNHAMEVVYEWDYHDAYEVFVAPYIGGVGSLVGVSEETRAPKTVVTEQEIAAAKSLHDQFFDIDPDGKKALQMALSRWRMAKKRENQQGNKTEKQVDQMIDLGIAFESIYLHKSKEGGISSTLSTHAAWFLGKNAEERERILREFKAIYRCRSDAVHTGELDDPVQMGKRSEILGKKSETPLEEFLATAQDRCAVSIKKIIERGGFPDWGKLITGNE